MRSLLSRSLQWAVVLALPSMASIAGRKRFNHPTDTSIISVQEYDQANAYTRFYLSGGPEGVLTSPLAVELQVPYCRELHSPFFFLNGQTVDIDWSQNFMENLPTPDHPAHNSAGSDNTPEVLAAAGWTDYSIMIDDAEGVTHNVSVSLAVITFGATPGTWSDSIQSDYMIKFRSVDGRRTPAFGFSVRIRPFNSYRRLSMLDPIGCMRDSRQVDFDQVSHSFVVAPPPLSANAPAAEHHAPLNQSIEAEIASLIQLQGQADRLKAEIESKQQVIAAQLQTHRNRVSLRHLLSECDGVVCAAKVIAQRICDKVGITTVPSFRYVQVQGSIPQDVFAASGTGNGSLPQNVANSTKPTAAKGSEKGNNATSTAGNRTLVADEGKPAVVHVDFATPADALVKILEIIASAIGLVTLVKYLHRKLMPMRTRVEREADREERRNARAYRRAARRAEMRARWDRFVGAINCFGSRTTKEPEEKQALIVQEDYAFNRDMDEAEKGEVMGDEIRDLRSAHALVANMVHVGEHRYDLTAPVHDPPPALVPLPFTPLSRSRASSATLPSYTSDILPDYISRLNSGGSSAGNGSSSSRSVEGFPHYSSTESSSGDDDGSASQLQSTAPSEVGSRRSRLTFISSILDTSPRISQETYRTRQSRDARYSRDM